MRGIEAQFLALQKGFTELIPQHLLKPFDHKELEVHMMWLEWTEKVKINTFINGPMVILDYTKKRVVKFFQLHTFHITFAMAIFAST